ncbi:MAG: sugar phosphate isomerase/epimerase [Bryobacterales bacterium]|nr:sugar phosphate isomerase/epimerase [Bryobacterales bacterium]MDE0296826.1 sugar phosphate isomerase/epimerase [Bryobacterales bacterium]MDE0435720.1 sugar phosphate isomerase/epimerase [Bryobacterales bacterium]
MNSKSTRRELMAATLGWAALAACSSHTEDSGTASGDAAASAEPRMKLSMSVRVAEKFDNKREASLTIDQLIRLARENGYQALCMRASQAGTHTAPEEIERIGKAIHDAGMVVSMVTGDFFVPQNDENGPDGLRNITPYLDLAEAFDADLIRICMKKEEDIAWAQKASDEARERNIRLAHQAHNSSLFETVRGSVDVLRKVGRDNFGIIYEPANWFVAGEEYGRNGILAVKDYIFNVYVQNHRLNPEAESAIGTWGKGKVGVDHIGLWDEGGCDFEEVFETLHGIDYRGYVTVHQAFEGVMSVEDAIRRSYEYLQPLTA